MISAYNQPMPKAVLHPGVKQIDIEGNVSLVIVDTGWKEIQHGWLFWMGRTT